MKYVPLFCQLIFLTLVLQANVSRMTLTGNSCQKNTAFVSRSAAILSDND